MPMSGYFRSCVYRMFVKTLLQVIQKHIESRGKQPRLSLVTVGMNIHIGRYEHSSRPL